MTSFSGLGGRTTRARKVVHVLGVGAFALALAGCGDGTAPPVGGAATTSTQRTVEGVCCGNPDGEVETPDGEETTYSPLADDR